MTRFIIFFMGVVSITSGYTQTAVSASQGANEKEVKQTINQFFDGFHKGDTAVIKQVIAANISLQTVLKKKTKEVKLSTTNFDSFLTIIHNRPKDQQWKEKLTSYTIIADDQLANAWTPYEFYVNEKFSHCGVNSFQLYKSQDGWKIISIVDTRKIKECAVESE